VSARGVVSGCGAYPRPCFLFLNGFFITLPGISYLSGLSYFLPKVTLEMLHMSLSNPFFFYKLQSF
jgi:hypothetical protein